jgi:two-component system response regulator DesR
VGGEDDRAFLTAASEIIAALDEVPSRIALLDDHGNVRWQNRASLDVWGSVSGHFTASVPPTEVAEAQAALDAVLRDGSSVDTFAHRLVAGNGDYVGVLGRLNAVELHDGTKVVVVVNLADLPAAGTFADRGAGRATVTRRQLDVLRLLDQGRSTAEIARELTLSPTTVRNHIANILAALGAHSRLQAVATARASGVLSD